MSELFCTREFSSATPEDRAARRPRGGICKSRRLPQGLVETKQKGHGINHALIMRVSMMGISSPTCLRWTSVRCEPDTDPGW
jgi:hypothetical protein